MARVDLDNREVPLYIANESRALTENLLML